MERILEYEITCPICKTKFIVSEYLYKAPYVGKIIISSGVCPKCNFKWCDVQLAESKGPCKIIYHVKKPDDLNALIIRASTATIRIPEVGAEIIPGYVAQGYITTIEGLVMDILEKTRFLCSDPNTSQKVCQEKIRFLEKAVNGEISFTIEIIDPMGVSGIISDKARIIPIKQDDKGEIVK